MNNKFKYYVLFLFIGITNDIFAAGRTNTSINKISNFLNHNITWIILEHTLFHLGKTKSLYYGFEGTLGISNGIGWYPRFLNFHKNFRMGIGDFQFNIINVLYDVLRLGFFHKSQKKPFWIFKDFISNIFVMRMLVNIHILSFKVFSFLTVKLFSLVIVVGNLLFLTLSKDEKTFSNFSKKECDVILYNPKDLNGWYLLFSPVIQIDILKCIDFFNA